MSVYNSNSKMTQTNSDSFSFQKQDYQEIHFNQTPTESKWKLVSLYKISLTGGQLFWRIGFDGVNKIISEHGYVNGAIQESPVEVIAKVNRTIQEQALQEAKQKYSLKYKTGYRPAGSTEIPEFEAMSGKPYYDEKKDKFLKIDSWPVAVEPKLDGIRMLRWESPDGKAIWRTRAKTYYTHFEHVDVELEDFFLYLPSGSFLDGEMYTPDMTFGEITSAVKTIKTRHHRLTDVHYHIFDIVTPIPTPFEGRFSILLEAYRSFINDKKIECMNNDIGREVNQMFTVDLGVKDIYNIIVGYLYQPNTKFHIVPYTPAANHDDIMKFHDQYVKLGYEGVIIRKLANKSEPGSKIYASSLYKPGKGTNFVKFKKFSDEEGTIIGIESGKGKLEGAAIFKVRDSRGNEFTVKLKGEVERLKEYYEHPETVIGKQLTYSHQVTEGYDAPRFPVGIAVRDYE